MRLLRTPKPALAVALAVTLVVATAALRPAPACAQAQARAAATVVYLVRHAEKEAEPTADPPLTAEGSARADALAHALSDAGVTAVYSTDYARTRDTAAPVAARAGVELSLYDPRDLPGLAATIRAMAGRILVVGHSNTTPALVAMLGGEPGEPIDEPTEYDRLYVLFLDGDTTTTTLLRYGDPSPPR